MRARYLVFVFAVLAGCNSILGIDADEHPLAAADGGGPAIMTGGDGAVNPNGSNDSGPGLGNDASSSQDSGAPDSSTRTIGDSGCTPCTFGTAKLGACCVQ